MDQITRFYRIMYGSMDSLFVNRREAPTIGNSHLQEPIERPRAYSHNLAPGNGDDFRASSLGGGIDCSSSKLMGNHFYPSEPNLKSLAHLDSDSEAGEEFVDADEDEACFLAAAEQSRQRTNSAIEIGNINDNCSMNDLNNNNKQAHSNGPSIYINGNMDSACETHIDKSMSKSCQNLTRYVKNPTAAHRKLKNNCGALKSSGDRMAGHGHCKTNGGETGPNNNNHHNNNGKTSNKKNTKKVEITSTKELIEVLIYNLQIAERNEKNLLVLNSNLEKANQQLAERLSIARQEMKLLEQKCSHLRQQIWRCILCSRDKIDLYSAEIRIAALECGHCYCTSCCQQFQDCHSCIQYCQICKEKFIVERIVHL